MAPDRKGREAKICIRYSAMRKNIKLIKKHMPDNCKDNDVQPGAISGFVNHIATAKIA